MRRQILAALLPLILLVGSISQASAQEAPPASAEELLEKFGFDQSALARVKAGEILTTELIEGTERELGLAVIMLIKEPFPDLIATIKTGKTLQASQNVLAFKEIAAGPSDEDAFAEARFDANESGEIKKLLSVKPGSTFNLSAAEIAQLQAAAHPFAGQGVSPQAAEAMNAAYRRVLLNRYRAYRAGGLAGIAPYDRGGVTVHAGEDLAGALPRFWILPEKLPDFYRALQNYPKDQPPAVENRFLWIKEVVQDRPTFVLAHRTFLTAPGYAVIAERQYYAGQSFNALLTVLGVSPTAEGSLVFYGNRTETDQVGGFGSGAKHSIGRGFMKDAIVKDFKAMRAKAGG